MVRPVVKALTPRAKEKVLGTDLDAELSNAVVQAWEKAAGRLCETAQPPCEIADLDELGSVVGRALSTEGTAAGLVISLLDSSRPFDWAGHPQAEDIIEGIDPDTAPVDVRRLGEAFIAALREELVYAARKRGLFEQAVVAGLEDLKGKNATIEALIRDHAAKESISPEQIEGQAEPAPVPPAPHQLLPDVALFTGRETELARLRDLLPEGSAGTLVISAIAGIAGVGKTALALHLAHELVPRFPDIQLFVNLHGYDVLQRLSQGEVLDRFLRALGVAPEALPTEVEEQAALYRSLLAGRRALVVLDNASSSEQVQPLLPGSPTCLVLITSRRRLAALEGALPLDLDIMDLDDALDFLRKLAGPERVDAELEAAHEIVALCGHLPLALRIADGRLGARPTWTLSWLVGRLADERTRLKELKVENLEVRTSFALSYRDLAAPAARMFRRLGLVAGPDFAAGVAAVLADNSLQEAEALLEELVDTHLLEAAHTPGRYRFHDLLRLYARERVEAEDDDSARSAARRRMLTWYLDTITPTDYVFAPRRGGPLHERGEVWPDLMYSTTAQLVAWLDTEWANLLAAIDQAAACGLYEIAWQIPDALHSFVCIRSRWMEWRDACLIGSAAAQQADNPMAEAWMLTSVGVACRRMRRFNEAIGYLQQGLAIDRETGDHRGEAWAMRHLGLAHRDLGRLDEAIDYLQQALAIHREMGDRGGEAWAIRYLGLAHRDLGRLDEAIDYLQQALAIHREMGDSGGEAWALGYLGLAHRDLRRFDEAIDYLQQALAIAREVGHRYGVGIALCSLGTTYSDLGRLDEAIDYLQQALAIQREIGSRWGEGQALQSLGLALQRTQRRDEAAACWQEALTIFDELGTPEAEDVRALLAG